MQKFIEALNKKLYYKDGKLYNCRDDTEAGWLCDNKYMVVDIQGKKYLSHRIIYFIHYNYFPEMVDHIDGNKLNNSIENLRPSNKSLNGYNRKPGANNSSGFVGVSFNKMTRKYESYISINGKKETIGYFADALSASKARYDYVDKLYEEAKGE